jgi:spore coat-associated protein N
MSILQKNKKAAAGIGVAAAAAAVLALSAGTYAAFSDTEKADATFATGTLDLRLGGSADAGPIQIGPVYPGWTGSHEFTVDNVGTVDGNLSVKLVNVTGDDNGCNDAEAADDGCTSGDLARAIQVYYGTQHLGSIADLNGQASPAGVLAANAPATGYELTFEVPSDTGNEIQSDRVTATIEVTLEQPTP